MFQSTDELVIGIDVSHHNLATHFDYAKASTQLSFCIIRVAYGATQLDELANAHAQGFAPFAVPLSFYLFALMDQDPQATAQTFTTQAKKLGWNPATSLPLFLDVEAPPENSHARAVHDAMTPSQRVAWLKSCLATLDAQSGRVAGIYSGPGYWNSEIASADFSNRPYWAARYPTSAVNPDPQTLLASQPAATTGWGQRYAIWQYTANGTLDGYDGKVDKSVMRKADLASRLQPSQAAAPSC